MTKNIYVPTQLQTWDTIKVNGKSLAPSNYLFKGAIGYFPIYPSVEALQKVFGVDQPYIELAVSPQQSSDNDE